MLWPGRIPAGLVWQFQHNQDGLISSLLVFDSSKSAFHNGLALSTLITLQLWSWQVDTFASFIAAQGGADLHQEPSVLAEPGEAGGQRSLLQLLQERCFIHEQEQIFIRWAFQSYGPNPCSNVKLPG